MRELINGAEAISRAALDAGCDFFAGYPITPATPILLHMMRELPLRDGIAIQAEDEIAAIGMCIGAVIGGKRALTATSGPGMSLYSENLGLAVMGEVPLVIVDCQRMGPATGAATTTSQGDVQFLRWGTSGGFPLIVLAPANVEACYHCTIDAFQLAERYRIPVIVATDKETVSTFATIDTDRLIPSQTIERHTLPGSDPYRLYDYARPDLVVPLASMEEHIIRFNTSSHDPAGYLTKEPDQLDVLNTHLQEKIYAHQDDIDHYDYVPVEGARTLVISYGIAAGSALKAVQKAAEKGIAVSSLILTSLWPIPERILTEALHDVDTILVVEMNNGQYAREVERLAHMKQTVRRVTSVNGVLIPPETILQSGGVQ